MNEIAITVPQEKPSSSVLAVGALPSAVNLHALMEYRRGQARRREWKPLGRLEKLFFEASGVADVDGRTNRLAAERGIAMLDWRGTGPLVGMTQDRNGNPQDALIVSPMLHPPALPEPDWKPDPWAAPTRFVNGIPIPPDPPTIPQRLRDRASGVIPGAPPTGWDRFFRHSRVDENDFYFVFQPLTQIVVLFPDNTGIHDLMCSADAAGRHTTLLYNPHRLEGHIIFGTLDVQTFKV